MEKKLIQQIKKYPALYDRKCFEYRSRRARILSWKAVTEAMGIAETRCQARWKSLRDRYMREYATIQQASGSEADACESPWELYKDMGFLKDQVKPRKNFTSDYENVVPSSSQESMILLPEYTEQSMQPATYNNDFSQFLENMTHIAEKRFSTPTEPKNSGHEGFFGMVTDLFSKLPAEDVEDEKIAFINSLHTKIKSYRMA